MPYVFLYFFQGDPQDRQLFFKKTKVFRGWKFVPFNASVVKRMVSRKSWKLATINFAKVVVEVCFSAHVDGLKLQPVKINVEKS